jgi:hypothetical protein
VQLRTVREASAEVARRPAGKVVAHDAQAADSVMKTIEMRRFELREAIRNDSAPRPQPAIEAMPEMHVQTVREEMAAAKHLRVSDQFVHVQADGSVVRGNDCTGTDTDHRIDWDGVTNQLPEDAGMRGAAQSAGAEHKSDTNAFRLNGGLHDVI